MYRLNEHGRRIWRHKVSKILFAQQSYEWVDMVSIIQEDGDSRQHIGFSTPGELSEDNWVPVTKEEMRGVRGQLKEMYNEYRLEDVDCD